MKTESEVQEELATLRAKRAHADQFRPGTLAGTPDVDQHKELDAAIKVLSENITDEDVIIGTFRHSDYALTAALNARTWRDDEHKDNRPPSLLHFSHIVSLLLLIGSLFFSGCSTTPSPQSMASYIADARDIAELGTTAALLENKALRGDLETTRDFLYVIEQLPAGTVTVDDLLRALSHLPIEKLQSTKGQVYVTGGRIVVRRFVSWVSTPELDVGASGYVQQFAHALREGIDAGLIGVK